MFDRGWRAEVWSHTAVNPEPVSIGKCTPKIFYVKWHHKTIPRAYVETLANLANLKTSKKEICHFEKPVYYNKILRGKAENQKMESDFGILRACRDAETCQSKGEKEGCKNKA